MSQPPPDDLKQWTKEQLITELQRLRAVLREHAEQPGGVLIDARSAVLLEGMKAILMDTTPDEPPSMMLLMEGRVNYSHDRVEHAYLYGPDGAAAFVSEHIGLAGRAAAHDERFADEFKQSLDERMENLP